ncbi:nephrin-like [Daphnia carinata]|uniref:nephrin-like n=1 Tax=Daphnia carinata TaxID=120202 RepID=UPI00257C1ED4|nr:nephrin-like [Daphnia carinata]XP_059352168.1 nephrin-like [Daphnia carinata]
MICSHNKLLLMKLFFFSVWRLLLFMPCPSSAQGLASKSNVPLRNLVVLANSTAELVCDTVPPDRHDEVILVLWFRENVGTPIFSADAREVSLSQAGVWFDEDILKKRATFRGRVSEPSILAVSNISLADQSVYRCRVDFREAKSRNSRINLTVIEPPKSLTITAEFSQTRISTVVGPFRIGDRPKFTCTVEGGLPIPVITWRRNRITVPGQMESSEPERIRSTLLLPPLKRSDWPMTLTCSASNSERGRPLEQSFDVDMELPPLSVSIVIGERNPAVGKPFSLPCHVTGSRPIPKITWWKNDVLLDPSAYNQTLSINGSVAISVLDLMLAKTETNSRITCRAINPYLDTIVMEDTWNVNLSYPPNVSLAMGRSLNAEGIKAGDDVYFDCHVDARPPASRIEWRRDGIKLVHNTSANVIITNQSLVLQNVGRSMAGNISCHAFNVEGQAESQRIFLDIKYAPVCKPGLTRYFGVSRAENVEIACQVEANPSTELGYKWFFNNSAETIEVPRSRYNNSPSASVLTYKPLASLDYGTLLCFATNAAGTQNEPCVFHILTAGPPEPVFNCTVSNHSSDAILIACQAGFHGGLPQNFSLHFYEESNSSGRLVLHQVFAEPLFLLSSLKTNMRYKASIASINAKGKSEDVIVEISTLKEPERQLEVKPGKSSEPRPSSSILTPTLGILTGVVILLCIAGVIVVVFLRRQCLREAQAAANNDGTANGILLRSEATNNQTNGTAGGASTISKSARGGGVNPRSQSLKPLMDNVDCNIDPGGPVFVSRIEPDHWKNQMFCHTTQLGWPVGEPPPSSQTPPPPPPPPNVMMTQQQSIEAGLITPPYTTDSSLELRSPDIIPPPIIGSCDFGPATLPRSYKGFGMGSSSTLAAAATPVEAKKPHVLWSDTMPKAFRQSHDFLRRETSSHSAGANKRESVV